MDKDKDLNLILKESLTIRTRINITAFIVCVCQRFVTFSAVPGLKCTFTTTVYCLLFAVTHAPFHMSSAEAYSWPSARDRRDREVN